MKPDKRSEEPKLFDTSLPSAPDPKEEVLRTHPALPTRITQAERDRETRGVDVSAEKKSAYPEIFGVEHIVDSHLERFKDVEFKKSLTPEQFSITMVHLKFCGACYRRYESIKGEIH